MCERDGREQIAKLCECDAATGTGACECVGGLGVSVNTARAWMAVGQQCLHQSILRAQVLLLAAVVGLAFATTALAQNTETKVLTPKLADWVYRKPPRDVPLRVGVLPPDATNPLPSENSVGTRICNRIWLDQTGSYDRPFAITYASQNKVSKTEFFPGIFALDTNILQTQNDWARLEPAKGYGKGDRGVFNARQEAVLLIDHEHETGRGNRYFSLYLKRLTALPCEGLKKSECKRFEAEAELYEFELTWGFPDYLRKADLGKVYIDSRCVGQQYLYHREPFLEKTSWFEQFLNKFRND